MKAATLPTVMVAIASLALLSGCGLFPQPDPVIPDPPAAGTCLAERAGDVIDRASDVPCTEDHLFDVTGSVTWDGMDAAIEADDAESVYQRLASGDDAEFESAMFDACDELSRRLFGIGGLSTNGVDAASMDLAVLGPLTDFSLADRERFLAGDHATLCVLRWTDFDDAERTVAYPEGIGAGDYASPEFPTDLHVCATSTDLKNTFLDCAEAHEAQQLLSFNGIDAVGAEWIATVNPDDFSVANYDVPDAVCADLVAQAFPELPVDVGWQVWSNIFAGSAGWEAFDGTVDPDAGYFFSCELVAATDDVAILGDAFSGTATIVTR